MTRIKFERSGGIVGQNIDLDLDLDTIPANEMTHLMHLIQESDFFHLPQDMVAKASPDEFEYTITVESGAMQHNVCATDTSLPDALRPLIHELSTLARAG